MCCVKSFSPCLWHPGENCSLIFPHAIHPLVGVLHIYYHLRMVVERLFWYSTRYVVELARHRNPAKIRPKSYKALLQSQLVWHSPGRFSSLFLLPFSPHSSRGYDLRYSRVFLERKRDGRTIVWLT